MANANINFNVTGTDKTGAAFQAVGWRAKQLSSILKGALAFSGAYFGFGAVKSGVKELGHLGDIAQKANTSVSELTRASEAFSVIGIQNVGVDQLGKAFDNLQKTTGRRGFAGFLNTIEQIGKIEDVTKRSQEAVRIFGGSGMEFMPLINAADKGCEAIKGIMAAMPGVSNSAAAAGKEMSDAMGFAANQVKSIWLQGLGTICGWFDNEYTGGVREASLTAGNYMEYYAKVYTAKVITWYRKIQEYLKRYGDFWGTLVGAKMGGASWGEALKMATSAYEEAAEEYEKVSDELEKKEKVRTERFKRNFDDRAIAIKDFKSNYDEVQKLIEERNKADADRLKNGNLDEQTPKQKTIKNELILAGSNEARKLQILGPTLQSEQKKTNQLLSDIKTTLKDVEGNQENEIGNTSKVLD